MLRNNYFEIDEELLFTSAVGSIVFTREPTTTAIRT